jgi:hypothetical protein
MARELPMRANRTVPGGGLLAWILSDLRIDASPPWKRGIPCPKPASDIAVICGNVGPNIKRSIDWLATSIDDRPVILVLGNRDRCPNDIDKAIDTACSCAAGTNVVVLEEQAILLEDRSSRDKAPLTLIAATLWSDFSVLGEPDADMALAATEVPDFRARTPRNRRLFHPREAVARHARAKSFIERALREAPGRCVVATHFAPCLAAVDQRTVALASYAASDLTDLMRPRPHDASFKPPAVWIHGHTVATTRFRIGETLILSNGKGTGPWRPGEPAENARFDPALVITL